MLALTYTIYSNGAVLVYADLPLSLLQDSSNALTLSITPLINNVGTYTIKIKAAYGDTYISNSDIIITLVITDECSVLALASTPTLSN
jgi:hypothetical protein